MCHGDETEEHLIYAKKAGPALTGSSAVVLNRSWRSSPYSRNVSVPFVRPSANVEPISRQDPSSSLNNIAIC